MRPDRGTRRRKEHTITIGELGEFGLIRAIIDRSGTARQAVVGPGDDAAVVAVGAEQYLATTDVLVEGRHFRRDWASAEDIGRRAAAANLSDIAAMGGRPTGLLVALVLPAATPISWVEGLADGLRAECEPHGAAVIGGDLADGDAVVLSVTALGALDGTAAVLRSGASPGDQLALAGRVGFAAAGLAVLRRGFRSPAAVVAAYRRPEVPYEAGPLAARLGATAMCDVSDGLLVDAATIATASEVRLVLELADFPVPPALRDVAAAVNVDPLSWIFGGGEDHALLACFPAGVALAEPWRVVGRVEAGSGVIVSGLPDEGAELASSGHEHWAAPSG